MLYDFMLQICCKCEGNKDKMCLLLLGRYSSASKILKQTINLIFPLITASIMATTSIASNALPRWIWVSVTFHCCCRQRLAVSATLRGQGNYRGESNR